VNSRFLKGRTILAKALLFGLVLWIINSIINLTGLFDYGVVYGIVQLGLGLAASLVYGYLLGRLYPRFRRKTVEPNTSTVSRTGTV